MKRFLIVGLLLCAAAPLTAQTIKADRILIDTEFVPRFLDLPQVKVIAHGEVWEAPESSTWDYLEVRDGVLSISRSHNTTLRFTHLFVLPGGHLNAGSEGSCIPPDIHVEFIVRDVPIDTKRDPFQWGNGLLNFGTQDRCGAAKRAWTTLTGSALAGATAITLAEDPNGWRVGDELLLPDMLPSTRQEASVFVAAIAGRQVTLSKPLDFDHRDILRPDGQLVLHPRVANLTRNIVIHSEGQTPGHTADIGHTAMWHVAYNEINGLGRTKNVPLDNTTPDLSHIGTNQIARYADHYHHAMGMNSYTRGSVLRGTTAKWGVVVHATHDATIDNNIAIGFKGAGFVTEDGYETRTTFSHNFAAYNFGNHSGDINMEKSNDNVKNPGAAGDGFWFRSRNLSTIVGNEAWNNIIGINDFGVNQVLTLYPSVPGGTPDTPLNNTAAVPVEVRGNVTAANRAVGFESWGNPRYPNRDLISANSISFQFFQGISEPARPYLVNPTLIAQDGDGAVGVFSPVAYVNSLDVEGGYIGGNRIGIDDGGGVTYVTLRNLTLQNVLNLALDTPTRHFQQIDSVHKPLGSHPSRYIEFGTTKVWDGVSPTPRTGGVSPWVQQRGSQWSITNWQGTGKNYQLFTAQMRGSLPAWPSTVESVTDEHIYDCPEAGLTNLECWTKYGMSYGGDVIKDTDIVPLEGLSHGLAREGSTTALGPPRAVVTSPTLRHDASGAIRSRGEASLQIQIQLSGDDSRYHNAMARVDGGRWEVVPKPYDMLSGVRILSVRGAALTPGVHTIETVRVDDKNATISPMTFQYRVGDGEGPSVRRNLR